MCIFLLSFLVILRNTDNDMKGEKCGEATSVSNNNNNNDKAAVWDMKEDGLRVRLSIIDRDVDADHSTVAERGLTPERKWNLYFSPAVKRQRVEVSEPSHEGERGTSNRGEASASSGDLFLQYNDVVEYITGLEEEIFFPYTRCERAFLDRVDSFYMAVLDPSSSSPRTTDVCGIVGVVWEHLHGVPRSSTAMVGYSNAETKAVGRRVVGAVEGYLQVVVILPAFRRCGLCRWLLGRCFRTQWTRCRRILVENADPADPDAVLQVRQWRLHTLISSEGTLQYLARHTTARVLPLLWNHSHTMCAKMPEEEVNKIVSSLGENNAVLLERLRWTLDGTGELYRGFGFVVRRFVYGYYDAEGDGMEMTCDAKKIRVCGPLLPPKIGSAPKQEVRQKKEREG